MEKKNDRTPSSVALQREVLSEDKISLKEWNLINPSPVHTASGPQETTTDFFYTQPTSLPLTSTNEEDMVDYGSESDECTTEETTHQNFKDFLTHDRELKLKESKSFEDKLLNLSIDVGEKAPDDTGQELEVFLSDLLKSDEYDEEEEKDMIDGETQVTVDSAVRLEEDQVKLVGRRAIPAEEEDSHTQKENVVVLKVNDAFDDETKEKKEGEKGITKRVLGQRVKAEISEMKHQCAAWECSPCSVFFVENVCESEDCDRCHEPYHLDRDSKYLFCHVLHKNHQCTPCKMFYYKKCHRHCSECKYCHHVDHLKDYSNYTIPRWRCVRFPSRWFTPFVDYPTCHPPLYTPKRSWEDLENRKKKEHRENRCLPCAWFRSSKGCSMGDACLNCHEDHEKRHVNRAVVLHKRDERVRLIERADVEQHMGRLYRIHENLKKEAEEGKEKCLEGEIGSFVDVKGDMRLPGEDREKNQRSHAASRYPQERILHEGARDGSALSAEVSMRDMREAYMEELKEKEKEGSKLLVQTAADRVMQTAEERVKEDVVPGGEKKGVSMEGCTLGKTKGLKDEVYLVDDRASYERSNEALRRNSTVGDDTEILQITSENSKEEKKQESPLIARGAEDFSNVRDKSNKHVLQEEERLRRVSLHHMEYVYPSRKEFPKKVAYYRLPYGSPYTPPVYTSREEQADLRHNYDAPRSRIPYKPVHIMKGALKHAANVERPPKYLKEKDVGHLSSAHTSSEERRIRLKRSVSTDTMISYFPYKNYMHVRHKRSVDMERRPYSVHREVSYEEAESLHHHPVKRVRQIGENLLKQQETYDYMARKRDKEYVPYARPSNPSGTSIYPSSTHFGGKYRLEARRRVSLDEHENSYTSSHDKARHYTVYYQDFPSGRNSYRRRTSPARRDGHTEVNMEDRIYTVKRASAVPFGETEAYKATETRPYRHYERTRSGGSSVGYYYAYKQPKPIKSFPFSPPAHPREYRAKLYPSREKHIYDKYNGLEPSVRYKRLKRADVDGGKESDVPIRNGASGGTSVPSPRKLYKNTKHLASTVDSDYSSNEIIYKDSSKFRVMR